MIEIKFHDLALWLTGLPLLLIAAAYVAGSLRMRRERIKARNTTLRCRACGQLFRVEPREKELACPTCGRLNQAGRSRRLG